MQAIQLQLYLFQIYIPSQSYKFNEQCKPVRYRLQCKISRNHIGCMVHIRSISCFMYLASQVLLARVCTSYILELICIAIAIGMIMVFTRWFTIYLQHSYTVQVYVGLKAQQTACLCMGRPDAARHHTRARLKGWHACSTTLLLHYCLSRQSYSVYMLPYTEVSVSQYQHLATLYYVYMGCPRPIRVSRHLNSR